jgi:hypothetical protein
MGSWFKGFVLGIAALLGLSTAGEPPPATLRPFRDATTIYASVEVLGLPGQDLERVVDASFNVRIQATVWAGNARAEAYRDISYDGLRYEVRVSETGGIHRTSDRAAAWAIASRFNKMELGPISALRFPLAMGCKVSLSLPEDPGYDPMVVWGYKSAASYRELDSVGLVPYY